MKITSITSSLLTGSYYTGSYSSSIYSSSNTTSSATSSYTTTKPFLTGSSNYTSSFISSSSPDMSYITRSSIVGVLPSKDYVTPAEVKEYQSSSVKEYRNGNYSIVERYYGDTLEKVSLFKVLNTIPLPDGTYKANPLTAIVIPDGVTCIESTAFNYVTNKNIVSKMYMVYIPDSVTEIIDYAFYNNPNIKYIRMSKNIKHIGTNAFANMKALYKMNIPDGCNFGPKYYNSTTGEHEYRNELSEILSGTKTYSRWTPWIESVCENGIGTVIFEGNEESFLQISLDMKKWIDLKSTNGKYQIKQDKNTRYFRVVDPNKTKTVRNNTDYIIKTRTVKINPIGL